MTPPSKPTPKRELVTYPLQMTREEWAELRLPTPLTAAEAQRVAEYVAALVTVEDVSNV